MYHVNKLHKNWTSLPLVRKRIPPCNAKKKIKEEGGEVKPELKKWH